jgi:hypothetical protein
MINQCLNINDMMISIRNVRSSNITEVLEELITLRMK